MFTARNVKTGSQVPMEADQYKQVIALSQGGPLQTAAVAGRLFSASSGTKVATTAGVTATWTGLGINNPSTSGKNVILHEFGFGQMLAADTIGAIGLQTASIAAPTADLTIYNCLDGSSTASVCMAVNADTLVSPVLKRVFSSYDDAAAAGENPLPNIYPLNGSLVIPPGRAVCSYTTLATTACYVFYYVWEEVSVVS